MAWPRSASANAVCERCAAGMTGGHGLAVDVGSGDRRSCRADVDGHDGAPRRRAAARPRKPSSCPLVSIVAIAYTDLLMIETSRGVSVVRGLNARRSMIFRFGHGVYLVGTSARQKPKRISRGQPKQRRSSKNVRARRDGSFAEQMLSCWPRCAPLTLGSEWITRRTAQWNCRTQGPLVLVRLRSQWQGVRYLQAARHRHMPRERPPGLP